jgi:hypothetical protein
MVETLRKASGEKLKGSTIFAYLDSIAQSVGNNTVDTFNILKQRNDEFVAYLSKNPTELSYWKASATFSKRDPLQGFLNLHPDLVFALREKAGLAWGAVDFGPLACGDIMHFDLRTLGAGKIIGEQINAAIPKTGHPTLVNELSETVIDDQDEIDTDFEEDIEHEHHEAIEEAEWTQDEVSA